MKKNIKILAIIAMFLLINIYIKPLQSEAQEAQTEKTIEDGTYVIKSGVNNDFVLDIVGASKVSGANLQLYKNASAEQQRFNVKYLGDGYYTITAVHSGKVLDVANAGKTAGTNVWQCTINNADAQKWIIKDAGDGYYYLISKCNGLYLDVANGVATNGTNVQVCYGNNSKAQKFKFEKYTSNSNPSNNTPTGTKTIEDGVYQIQSGINNKFVLDVLNESKVSGANIQLFTSKTIESQKFNVKYLGDGYYTIAAVHSGKVLDVANAGKTAGTNVWQCTINNADAQKWVIKDAGDGYYYLISKCNGLYLDVANGIAANGTNVQVCYGNNSNAQKFKFKNCNEDTIPVTPTVPTGTKTVEDGIYQIQSGINNKFVLDVLNESKESGANIQLYTSKTIKSQRFNVKYLGDGYYTIAAVHSGKVLDVANAGKTAGTNVWQCTINNADAQKWVIKDAGDGYYYLISKCNGLYLDVANGIAANGTNVQVCYGNNSNAQKFKFEKIVEDEIKLDTTKYTGYLEKIQELKEQHPNWNFKFLYTGIKFSSAVAGEAEVHGRNLVETSYSGEWICPTCGTKLYDSGWYCASEKAIAYYLDPRNFLDEVNIFQFQDVNSYLDDACTLEGIKSKVKNTFLENYAEDIEKACRNTNVNPYYIIARLIQEQGTKGTTIGKGMDGGDGKTYYNPFNIGASGNGSQEIYNNALARAKKEGWDSMQKAIEGGIGFCKANWLENYQNTLYQNRFDIDSTNGTALYTHQYMQNLMGAYSEAKTLQSMYKNTGKMDSNFTFIIPLYEQMNQSLSQLPSNTTEAYQINVETTGTYVRLRKEASANSEIIKEIELKGTVLLSIERGVNSDWQKVMLQDGTIGYVSGTYLRQVNDVTTCNYTAEIKTNDGNGCNIRLGPSTSTMRLTALADGEQVTVIDDATYKNIDGYNWSRIIIPDGRQAFIPSIYLSKTK